MAISPKNFVQKQKKIMHWAINVLTFEVILFYIEMFFPYIWLQRKEINISIFVTRSIQLKIAIKINLSSCTKNEIIHLQADCFGVFMIFIHKIKSYKHQPHSVADLYKYNAKHRHNCNFHWFGFYIRIINKVRLATRIA